MHKHLVKSRNHNHQYKMNRVLINIKELLNLLIKVEIKIKNKIIIVDIPINQKKNKLFNKILE
jgi:hypothetical protein